MTRSVLLSFALLAFVTALWAENTALVPVPRPDHVWKGRGETWMGRHESVKAQAAEGKAELILVGDSITHGWDRAGKQYLEEYFGKYHPINMGFGGDRTEHVLWRFDNGELDGIQPKLAVVMIGTNNWRTNTPEEIAEGVEAVCRKIQNKLPSTEILLLAIFPRADREGAPSSKTEPANPLIAQLGQEEGIHFLDINDRFLDEDGNLPKTIMPDLLHPNKEGYRIWAEAMAPHVERLMGK